MQKRSQRRCLLFVLLMGLLLSATYAGIFTLISYTICPAILQIKSRYIAVASELPAETNYKTFFSSDGVAWTLIVLSSCLIIGVLLEAIL